MNNLKNILEKINYISEKITAKEIIERLEKDKALGEDIVYIVRQVD